MQGASLHETGSDLIVAPVSLGGRPIGGLALKGSSLSDGALQALLNLVAIALERVRTEEAANRAEVARQSEEFKSTLLDAIAHEFKTPLTSIKAASTSILADFAALAPPLRELTTIIDEETDRLSLLVTEAVRMSQIDAGKVRIDKQPMDLEPVLHRVLDYFGARLEGRSVNVRIQPGLARAWGDPELISLALRQLVDNGLKYSASSAPIDIGAEAGNDRVLIRVRDRGPGIPEKERERVFDKFYRRNRGKGQLPGSGLGLHIAREILRAHGGDLWIEDAPGGGSDFCAALPAVKESVEV
jgi:two-component system, OmpR family, sensor histidine kinase KdpD